MPSTEGESSHLDTSAESLVLSSFQSTLFIISAKQISLISCSTDKRWLSPFRMTDSVDTISIGIHTNRDLNVISSYQWILIAHSPCSKQFNQCLFFRPPMKEPGRVELVKNRSISVFRYGSFMNKTTMPVCETASQKTRLMERRSLGVVGSIVDERWSSFDSQSQPSKASRPSWSMSWLRGTWSLLVVRPIWVAGVEWKELNKALIVERLILHQLWSTTRHSVHSENESSESPSIASLLQFSNKDFTVSLARQFPRNRLSGQDKDWLPRGMSVVMRSSKSSPSCRRPIDWNCHLVVAACRKPF